MLCGVLSVNSLLGVSGRKVLVFVLEGLEGVGCVTVYQCCMKLTVLPKAHLAVALCEDVAPPTAWCRDGLSTHILEWSLQ